MPVDVRHVDVGDNDTRRDVRQKPERLAPIGSADDPCTREFQCVGDGLAKLGIILDQQDIKSVDACISHEQAP